MSAMASQITSVWIVYSSVYSNADQRKHQSSRHWLWQGNSPVTSEFPAQRASNAENVFIWSLHHVIRISWSISAIWRRVILIDLVSNMTNQLQGKKSLHACRGDAKKMRQWICFLFISPISTMPHLEIWPDRKIFNRNSVKIRNFHEMF